MASVTRPSIDVKRRSNETEWLDRTDINPADLENVLRDLASFNRTFLGHYPLLRWVAQAVQRGPKGTPLSIVDVGCGDGELLRAIRRWSRRRGVELNLLGIDLNPETIRIARAATDPADRIDFRA